jgi:hypothetical protein
LKSDKASKLIMIKYITGGKWKTQNEGGQVHFVKLPVKNAIKYFYQKST